MTHEKLDAEAVAAVDATGQLQDVLSMPDQLRDAIWRTESARLDELDAPAGVIVCGMGGSAIGGDLAQAALGDRLSRPLHVVREYGLPAWATDQFAVLCASYSGNTEETLACFEAATALGAPRVAVTTGGELAERARADDVPVIGIPAGLQPRAAIAYMFVTAAEIVALTEAAPGLRAEVDTAAVHLESLVAEWGPASASDSQAKRIAQLIEGAMTCIYGADLTTAAARRWKCQLNENAKVPASWAELPEADHNEIMGWQGAPAAGARVAVFLQDSDQHVRVQKRIELTEKFVSDAARETVRVQTQGTTRTERLFSIVLLGDLVSIYLAVLRGVDPSPVAVIDELKIELAKT